MEQNDFSEYLDKLSLLDEQQLHQVYLKAKDIHNIGMISSCSILTDEELDMLLG